MLVGFGATGLLAHRFLGGVVLLGVALAGGVLFEALIVGPFWRFLFRFASNPLVTLESAITDLATAVTSFDAQGKGLIAVDVDGQVVQCLATLRVEDKAAGRRVRSGDSVRIEDVDAARGRCTVSVPQR
ncbi:MAG: hypothetical protein HYR75_04955 [Gemmatimonadetes bacterium]|nr:hypothetical protein [Gemmatimonadota bacterium]